MARRLDLPCAFLCATLLAGCVPIPIPVLESPAMEKAEKTITVDQTTRGDVLSSLGEPPFVRKQGALFVYNAERLHGYIILAILWGVQPVRIPFYDTELLAITFDDEGVVRGVERAANSCLPSGICLKQYGSDAVLLAPSSTDGEAKLFAPDPEFCTVYLFREDSEWQLTPKVTVNGVDAGKLPGYGFMKLRLAPGKHEFSVDAFQTVSQKLECTASQVIFWHARPIVSSSERIHESRFYLEAVSSSEGQSGVQKGKLLFGPLD